MPRYKTTKADFVRFKKFFLDLVNGHRLGNWKLTFKHKYLEENRAETNVRPENEEAEVILSTDWGDPDGNNKDNLSVTVWNLYITAFHEVKHLLLQPLVEMLQRYNAEKDEVEYIEHMIIDKEEHNEHMRRKKK